ncbi:thiamine transport system substrate-binding protein [Pseudooceanicola antarcticus]|uniref:Thiamine ABC transporter substrate binding subunit n=1 Tax=Pseudooceanicola antarcticus TaxID=1247613 RepID=A0A285HPY5_9RHOB|nr:thiamine ABC transporter substrate binding subunit [Pseudooceanicola antarcticus]PJE27686.1 thiamine ABC transporter substrate binding subunit [Pseudooceanicola antarcticus]SNY37788.1 thiamine transport system substrate-binding protein [Pseudooceanicola antarcticus]
MKHLALATGCLLATQAVAETPVLNVYTYESFTSEWGPGPQIEAGFEAECGCDVVFTGLGDGAALLSRVRLEGERSEADVVLGLDTSLMAQAKETGLFAPTSASADYDLPIAWTDETFVPFDWGYFAFVANVGEDHPSSFEALAASDASIVIQDPRSSTPGLGLLMWVKAVYGDRAPEIWDALSDNILTVTPGWSEAYGLFLDGEADMVLSYTTSPAYHIIAEGDETKEAVPFDEGHYMQVEIAGKLAASDQPELADAFLQYLLGAEAQGVLPETNWMYPAVMPEGGLAAGFNQVVTPDKALLLSPEEAQSLRDEALAEWQAALAR